MNNKRIAVPPVVSPQVLRGRNVYLSQHTGTSSSQNGNGNDMGIIAVLQLSE